MKLSNLITLTLLSLPALPSFAQAGALTDKAYQIAAQLGSRESSLTPAQQTDVSRELDALLATLTSQPAPSRPYVCVSRDNDGSRPYVVAYKDFASVVRIQGAVFNSKEECEQSLAAAQSFQGHLLLCSTRDNDGSRPYKIVALNGTANATILQRSILPTLDDCLAATHSMQARPEGLLYCGSRDNDGSAPFAQTGLRTDGSFVQSREEYRTLGECDANL